MEKEPKELKEARAALREAEADLANPQMLKPFKRGIDLLAEVILGEYSKTHKNVANRLAVSYRNKVVANTKTIMGEADSYELDYLQHWSNVMETFTESGLDDDSELRFCKDHISDKWWIHRCLKTLTPLEIEDLKKSLATEKAKHDEKNQPG